MNEDKFPQWIDLEVTEEEEEALKQLESEFFSKQEKEAIKWAIETGAKP